MSDAVLVGLFAALATIIAPCLVLIVKRITAVHKVVNSQHEQLVKEIAYIRGVLDGQEKS